MDNETDTAGAAARRVSPRGGAAAAVKTFLKPGWVLTAVLIVAFSYFAFTFLAPWQLGKNHDIGERNERIATAFETDPVDYREILDDSGALASPELEWRRVTVTGHYLPAAETVLRMRPVEGTPSVQVLTPLHTTGGQTVLVNRGWQRARGAEVPDFPAAPTGEVTVEAVVRADEPVPDRAPLDQDGHLQVYGINTGQIAAATDTPLGADYVQISSGDQPGALEPMPIPKLDRGSHLSYGLQWIAFGVMAPAGLGYFIWAELKERRRTDAERAEMTLDQGDEGDEGDEDLSAPPPDRRVHAHSRSVADRYGGGRRDDYAKFARRAEERF